MATDSNPNQKTALEQDLGDLNRGVAINTLGNLVKIAHPLLLGVAVALYGEVNWGIFVTAQAALLPIGRIAMLGLDKGLLWWTPRQSPENERDGILPSLLMVMGFSGLFAFVISTFFAPFLAEWRDLPQAEASIRWMAYGLIPMAVMDVFVSCCMGKRVMGAQLVVRDILWPLSQVMFALGFYYMGEVENGLAMAFLLSCLLSATIAWLYFQRVFRGSSWSGSTFGLPRELIRYALPMWGAEVINSWLMRVDQIIVFSLLGPAQAGVYGIVLMVGNAIRTIRRAFDPIVTAIFSGAQAANDHERIGANFSYATTLVIGSQIPVLAFIMLFSPWILPLLGDVYDSATRPIVILCTFWILNGALGLNGLILVGFGKSSWILFNVLIAIGVLIPLLYLWVPITGLEGAAYAVGTAYTVQNLIQVLQVHHLTGRWHYRADVAWIILISIVAFASLGFTWWALSGQDDWLRRVTAFITFLIMGVGLTWTAKRRGHFRVI